MQNLLGLILGLLAFHAYAWNAMGHQVMAQVAYDHLTPKAKQYADQLLSKSAYQGKRTRPCEPKLLFKTRFSPHSGLSFSSQVSRCSKRHQPMSPFVFASTWMDFIKYKNNHTLDALHYVDKPYSLDGTPLPVLATPNGLTTIQEAKSVLQSPSTSNQNKAYHLRILIHVVGDVHQPMHTITAISEPFPKGDRGGNLFLLAKNSIGRNLHQYWDRGGGFLLGGSSLEKARQLEAKWSCSEDDLLGDAEEWINRSHELAIKAYSINPGTVPNEQYQQNTQNISQRQLFLAGCRLAALVNQIAR